MVRKVRFLAVHEPRCGWVETFQTVSLGSTLAIWPGSHPPRLGALLKPLGLYTARLGRSTRIKSPYNKRTCSSAGRRVFLRKVGWARDRETLSIMSGRRLGTSIITSATLG
jgi:hypothetical protein